MCALGVRCGVIHITHTADAVRRGLVLRIDSLPSNLGTLAVDAHNKATTDSLRRVRDIYHSTTDP